MADPRTTAAPPGPKVSVPLPVDRAVPRPRLWAAAVDQGPHATHVLLACAPAGFGKSTMLAELADHQRAAGQPLAWVTCDSDDVATSFWGAVITAARAAEPPGSASRLGVFEVPAEGAGPAFVGSLIDVVREAVPGLVLVIDDAHQLVDGEVLDGLRRLVEGAGPELRVAFGCRFEPPIGLHRYRLTGRLLEVRAADLAFSDTEAHAFWGLHDVTLDEASESTLLTLTEGWPAGLRLAALSLRSSTDPEKFVEAFGGADRSVADYLSGEVLDALPDDVVQFLLSTCVAEDLTVDLAARLSGRADSAALLEDLAQQNALVARLDLTGTWFRYHALLRSYLTAALELRMPGEGRRLRAVAARWYLANDQPALALEFASAAKDADLVGRILLARGLGLILAGATQVVRRATAQLPPETRELPVVLVHTAIAAVADGDLVTADEALAALRAPAKLDEMPRMRALRRLAVLHRARLAADVAAAQSSGLLDGSGPFQLPDHLDSDIRLLVLADRGALRLYAGDYPLARQDLTRAVDLAALSGLPWIELNCRNLLAGALVAQNSYDEARVAAEGVISFAAQRGWEKLPNLAYAYVAAGWTSFQLLRPDEAATWAARSTQVIDTTIDVGIEGAARTGEAIIAFDQAPHRRPALERLERATDWLAQRGASPTLVALPAPHHVRMCLSLGEWQKAAAVVARVEDRLGRQGDAVFLLAQYAFARGRAADSRLLLRPLLAGELVPLVASTLTSAWLLDALIAGGAGRVPDTTSSLLGALEHAAPTGALRPFYDAGPRIRPLLAALRGRGGRHDPFLATVLEGLDVMDRWRAGSAHRPDGRRAGSSTEGLLTERELSVLREMPSLRTYHEIAETLGVSINTVKTHVRAIYTKLDSPSRRDAVSVARGRGLL